MQKERRPYSPAFRHRIVDLVHSGHSPKNLAMKFAPSAQTIRKWVDQDVYSKALARFKKALERPRSFPAGGWIGVLLGLRRPYTIEEAVMIIRDWVKNPEPKIDPFGEFIISEYRTGRTYHYRGRLINRYGYLDDLKQYAVLSIVLENNSADVIEALRRSENIDSGRALKKLLHFGRRRDFQGPPGVIQGNAPVWILRGLIARHPKYKKEFSARSIPPILYDN